MADAEPMGQRCVDIKHLARDGPAPLLVVLHGSNGTGALGKLDQGHAEIVYQRHQHLANVILLAVLLAQHRGVNLGLQVTDGGHAQYAAEQVADPSAKPLLHLVQCQALLAHGAVENTRNQAIGTHVQLCQNQRNVQSRREAIRIVRPIG